MSFCFSTRNPDRFRLGMASLLRATAECLGSTWKGCARFKKLDDLAADVVGRTVTRVSVERANGQLLGREAAHGQGP
jgi:hypothetical protein